LQNWHLYFFSGTNEAFRPAVGDAARVVLRAVVTGMVAVVLDSSLQDDG
jgi:hypothetical protein